MSLASQFQLCSPCSQSSDTASIPTQVLSSLLFGTCQTSQDPNLWEIAEAYSQARKIMKEKTITFTWGWLFNCYNWINHRKIIIYRNLWNIYYKLSTLLNISNKCAQHWEIQQKHLVLSSFKSNFIYIYIPTHTYGSWK